MPSKKEQLKASEIPGFVRISLVNFIHTLAKLELCNLISCPMKRGEVIHFCKRNFVNKKL